MKITINHPDGRIETRDGTPEELATFEGRSAPPTIRFVPYEVQPTRFIPEPVMLWPQPTIIWCGATTVKLQLNE